MDKTPGSDPPKWFYHLFWALMLVFIAVVVVAGSRAILDWAGVIGG